MGEETPAPQIVGFVFDKATSSMAAIRSDGMEARLPMDADLFDRTSTLARVYIPTALDYLIVDTLAGDRIGVKLPSVPKDDRLDLPMVVYLDQKDWSALDSARRGMRTSRGDRTALHKLVNWAIRGRIVLPVSAGHFTETAKRFDFSKRYGLGVTILQLSDGWQMRDPLEVRRHELRSAFRARYVKGQEPDSMEVFSLGSGVLYGPGRGLASGGHSGRGGPELPLEWARAYPAILDAIVSIDVLLDAERVEPGRVDGWVEKSQRFSNWLREQERDQRQKRKSIDAFLLADLQTEIAEEACVVGLSLAQLQDWMMNHAMEDISEMPSLGLFRELMHQRHLNKDTVWRSNDLHDMIYLSCAAGYADVVVCERHSAGVLTSGMNRLGRPSKVFRSVRDAVPSIEAALDAAPVPDLPVMTED